MYWMLAFASMMVSVCRHASPGSVARMERSVIRED